MSLSSFRDATADNAAVPLTALCSLASSLPLLFTHLNTRCLAEAVQFSTLLVIIACWAALLRSTLLEREVKEPVVTIINFNFFLFSLRVIEPG